MSLTRTGYVTEKSNVSVEKLKELSVRPVVNTEFGFPPPAFKVYNQKDKYVSVPRYWALQHFGKPKIDKRPEPVKMRPECQFTGQLRDQTKQNDAFRAGINAFKEKGGGVLSLPCGYGKTTVALSMACHMKVRTMIVVHKEFLANQWRERIKQFCPGATIGKIQQDILDTDHDFVIAMLQSLSQRSYALSDFEGFGMIIVDEAHHICARVFSQCLLKMCPKYTLGLTATPDRKDGLTKVLYWFLGESFFAVEREERGKVVVKRVEYTSEDYIEAPPVNRLGKVSLVTMITQLVESIDRTMFVVNTIEQAAKGDRNVLVLSERRQHCEDLHNMLGKLGYHVSLYMGGMKEDELKKAEEARIIIGTYSQAHEGLDIPKMDTLVMATPKSDIKQAVGRVLRETKGRKNTPVIWDICDNWCILNAMYYKRLKVYRAMNAEIPKQSIEPDNDDKSFKGKCLL